MPALRSPSLEPGHEDLKASRTKGSPGERAESQFVVVGSIAGAFGAFGEIKVDVETDFPERFEIGRYLFLGGSRVRIERSRGAAGRRTILKLDTVASREQAQALRGLTLDILESDVAPLPPGSHYRFQLIGLDAWTDDGFPLGIVMDLIETGAHDVFVIQATGGLEILIPNVPDVCDIDVERNTLTVHPIPGLIPDVFLSEIGANNDGGE